MCYNIFSPVSVLSVEPLPCYIPAVPDYQFRGQSSGNAIVEFKLCDSIQAQVDEGVPLKICLSQFCKWIQKIQQQKKITFATGVSDLPTSEVKLCAFVTWSGKKVCSITFF